MFLIVGLGNYGKEYERTPHNMGFLTADEIAKEMGLEFTKNKCHALVAEGFYNGEKVMIAKPQTYMNLSGVSLSELINKFKIPLENVIVILDDIDLPVGTLRYKAHGSGGTHNGLRNCVELVGTENFARIRIGVGKPNVPLTDFVLSNIPKETFEVLFNVILQARDKVLDMIKNKHTFQI